MSELAASLWAVRSSLVWSMGAGLVLAIAGAISGRPDVVLLGAGPVLLGVWTLIARPAGPIWFDIAVTDPSGRQEVEIAAPPGSLVRLRLHRPEHGGVEYLVYVPLTRRFEVTSTTVRTGPKELVGAEYQGVSGAGMLSAEAGAVGPATVLVYPKAKDMPALPLPSRLRGLTGQHESRRPGEGGGLRDVHPFQPGDPPRRVDWRVTARRSPQLEQLYVRRTMALGEATVYLVVDSRDDVGPDPATWSGLVAIRPDDATSLDLARQAAATVAQGYLAVGDRVAVTDLGVSRRVLRSGTGRRQLDRVLEQLALLAPVGDPPVRVRAPQLPPGSLVYVFSTFLDPGAATVCRAWHRLGHRVIAVDVLPRVRTGGLDARQWLALRIVRLERNDRLDELANAGIEVIPWAEPRSATAALQLAARLSHRRPGVMLR